MKKIIWVIICAMVLFPKAVWAQEKYTSLNLIETFEEEGVPYHFENYSENDRQITIYLFRGKGCSFCKSFLNYLADSLIEEYGSYFKLQSYEVWGNTQNAKLKEQVVTFFEDNARGVPYIIIGDKTFSGYSTDSNEEIKKAIMEEYNKKERFDLFKEMEKKQNAKEEIETQKNTTEKANITPIIIGNGILTIISTTCILYYIKISKTEIKKMISEQQQTKNKSNQKK